MLIKEALLSLLSEFADQEAVSFTGFPETGSLAAVSWARAAANWFTALLPVSSQLPAAEVAFRAHAEACFVAGDLNAFASAWQAMAVVAATGMVGWVALPPPLPPDFSRVYALGMAGASNAECLGLLADVLLAWVKTGTAVQLGTSTTIFWN